MRDSGRKAVLATGETEEELAEFPGVELFDLVVAENGAVLYFPATGRARRLADPPPARFARELRRRGVEPVKAGRVVVSTRRRWAGAMEAVMGELGMSW